MNNKKEEISMNNKKEEIRQAYYYTDIEPTLENLQEIIRICEVFMNEGGDRLMCAMDMRKWDLDEIERLTEYIVLSRQKMETELIRLRKYQNSFNDMFATDHNDYYNSVAIMLRRIRSHTSPLNNLLKKTCSHKHPNNKTCKHYHIKPKSVRKESVLASGTYQKPIFSIDDPTTPVQVTGLFRELNKFFADEKECMEICVKVLNEEAEIRRDPVKSKYVLDKYRRKAFEKLRGQIMLISDDMIDALKDITPAYQRFKVYATDEAFAQEEFHKHNITDMDHFCLIELAVAKQNNKLDNDELANWGDNPAWVKRIKYVIKHYDELLPKYFSHKMMGRFQYYFCKWALPGNIRNATKYFIKHYNGKWKVSQYGAVNSHGKKYDKNSAEVIDFHAAIDTLLKNANLPEMSVRSA